MSSKVFVLIEADLPRDMDEEDFAAYVQDSTRACVGGYHPNDPVFPLDRKSVKGYTIQTGEKVNEAISNIDGISITALSDASDLEP